MSFSKSFAFSGFSDEDGTLEFIGRVEDWLKGNVTEKEAKYKIDEDFNSGKRNTFNPYVLKYLEVTFFEEESYNLFKLSFDKNELENFRHTEKFYGVSLNKLLKLDAEL